MAMTMGSLGWASTTASKHQLWKNILPHTFNYRQNTIRSHSSSSSDFSPTNWGTQLRKRVTAFASGMGEIGGGREQVAGFVRASPSSAAATMKGDQQGEDLRWEATHTKEVEEMRGEQRSRKVAVIGCGASGLVAARELLREGHQVSVFEQGNSVGGVWVYDPEIETDLLGINVDRKRVHSSMYASLRTNLPREIMSFTDFPFLPTEKEGSQRDTRRFPGHPEVASYLQDFAEHYGLMNCIHFSAVVEYAGVREIGDKKEVSWKVRTRQLGEITTTKRLKEEDFDAVVVCNGHYSEPYVVPISGIKEWPGRQMHSHNYREPHSFADQIVVVIGNAASGTDIARELADFAKEVHISGRTWSSSVDFSEPDGPNANIWRHSLVECACEDGIVKFKDGGSVQADVILHCTGYLYSFPFLDSNGKVFVDNNCVGPLYEHVFVPAFGASLSFVGLPWKVVPFPICELQSRWVAMALSGRVGLPPVEEMMQSIKAFYAKLEASGKSKRLAHNLSTTQFQYVDWLADQTGSDHLETWRKTIYEVTSKNKRENTETYRDVWPDEDLHQEVLSSLKKRDVLRGDLSSYHLSPGFEEKLTTKHFLPTSG